MKFKTKYRLNVYKTYFDTGFGLLNYLKYPLVVLGVTFSNVTLVLIGALIYAIICFFLGWWWLRSDFYKAQIEVSNNYNIFVRQMRKVLVTPNK